AVPPQRPAGPLLAYLRGGQPLIGSVVPFSELTAYLGAVEPRQPARVPRAAQRAGEHGVEPATGELAGQRPRLLHPGGGEGDVGASGMATGPAPAGLAVAYQHDLCHTAHPRTTTVIFAVPSWAHPAAAVRNGTAPPRPVVVTQIGTRHGGIMSVPTRSAAPAVVPGKLDRSVIITGLVVIAGAIMVLLDTTIVNVALDTLSRELGAPLSTVQWVVTGYLLAVGVAIPVTGWAMDRFGARPVWVTSLVLFV